MKEKPILTILVGLPRSGKSTWIKYNHNDEIIVSNDWIRENIFKNHYSRSINPAIWMITDATIRMLLSQGKNIILDGVNLQKAVRKEFTSTAKECGATTRMIFIDTSLDECLLRNNKTNQLPEEQIIQMFKNIEKPSADEADEVIIVSTKEG